MSGLPRFRLGASLAVVTSLAVAGSFSACGGSKKKPEDQLQAGTGVAKSAFDGGDDRSRCEHAGRRDREVVESVGPGAIMPNIRRVYAVYGFGDTARKVLACREVDTNLDGVKDVVRTYDEKGEAQREQADADYDGTIDTWVTFASGRMAKVQTDTNGDGFPDEHRFYVRGKLSRLQRDTNFNGAKGGGACEGIDVWEIYREGRLERMGVDLNDDCQVDRWDRDEIAVRERIRREEEEADKAADAGAKSDAPTDAYVSARKR